MAQAGIQYIKYTRLPGPGLRRDDGSEINQGFPWPFQGCSRLRCRKDSCMVRLPAIDYKQTGGQKISARHLYFFA
jgi:hypothetical protein